jgi:proteasome component ECM29
MTRLRDIQLVLQHLLAEANPLAHEAAARGLALVYALADSDRTLQQQLVAALARSLDGSSSNTGSDSKSALKMIGDSELFPAGVLGSAPASAGGGALSTYRQLCSMASDVGQPELVYRFMQLAAHNAAWRARRTSAFAASALLRHARRDVAPQLARLVPALYRQSFDPVSSVAHAMRRVLRALCGGAAATSAAITRHFVAVLDELQSSLTV